MNFLKNKVINSLESNATLIERFLFLEIQIFVVIFK